MHMKGLIAWFAVCISACVRPIRSQFISLGLHVGVLALGFLVGSRGILPPAPPRPYKRPTPLYFTPPRPALVAESKGSGGANTSESPALRGGPREKSNRYCIAPTPHFEPKLPIP